MTATYVAADNPVMTELARSLTSAPKAIRELEQAAATAPGVTGIELAAIQALLDHPDGTSPGRASAYSRPIGDSSR